MVGFELEQLLFKVGGRLDVGENHRVQIHRVFVAPNLQVVIFTAHFPSTRLLELVFRQALRFLNFDDQFEFSIYSCQISISKNRQAKL